MRSSRHRDASGLVAGALAVALTALGLSSPVRLETPARTGHPDVRRSHDARGFLAHVDIDTDGDGRTDVEESYEDGRLVMRASDRNLDGRIDLIQDFDGSSEHTRSTVDVDFDGRADLMVYFSHGRPVVSTWARDQRVSNSGAIATAMEAAPNREGALQPLDDDPFAGTGRLRPASSRAPGATDIAEALARMMPLSHSRPDMACVSKFKPIRILAYPAHYRTPSVPRAPPAARHLV